MATNMWTTSAILSLFLLIIQQCVVFGRKNVIKLDEDNWHEMLEKEWMVEFYAPWCPACKVLQPVWEEFSTWSDDLNIKVGQVDVTTSPGLSGRFMVTALPTIFHVFNGEFRQYRGARDKDAFISFVEDKKWKTIDSIPSWKSPSSMQMSVVSYFFKLSQVLRAVHNKLMEEYGLPTWGSYLIFAVGTIFIGALLGLVLVCVIDLIYPPKPALVKSPTDSELKKEATEKTKVNADAGDGKLSGDEMEEEEEEEEEEDVMKEDLVDEELSDAVGSQSEGEGKLNEDSPNVRKRKPRKAD